jgi:AcrR family transcriptional regulator
MASRAPAASSPVRARARSAVTARSQQRYEETPRARVGEIQRSRLLAAASDVVDELGYSRTTVTHITQRARVSRRTFYDLFEDREDCVLAVFEGIVELLRNEVLGAAAATGPAWRERVRAGLWTILSFLDREPVLARVCVVEALSSGTRALERREEVLVELAQVLDKGRLDAAGRRGGGCPPLTAEGLVGAVLGIVYGRLLRGERAPLTDLFGELMGMIVLPYLGPGAARREQTLAAPVSAGDPDTGAQPTGAGRYAQNPLAELPMRVTYRTARVLEVLAACPGASNRVVGERSGVSDQGQISRLLARLERLDLVRNTGKGHLRGEANAWTLTATGGRVVQSIAHAGDFRSKGAGR